MYFSQFWKFLLLVVSGSPTCDATFYDFPAQWPGGANGNFYIRFPTPVSSWTIRVQFASAVNTLSVWNGVVISGSGTVCTFKDAGYNAGQIAGASLTLGFQVTLVLFYRLH